jgi:protein-S-isoprenylcysteine O-methyltransferase Ste14
MALLQNPFFWAFVSMFALMGTTQIASVSQLGRHPLFGILLVAVFALGRVVLVLPPLPQPRFELGGWHWAVGGVLFALGVIFAIPALSIKPFTAPDEKIKFRTDGFYGIVRNPIYLGEVLWCLGWSVMFRSIIGVFLVPFWWISLLFLIMIEEESLKRELGQPYVNYKNKVRGRITPGLPL